MDGMQIFRLDNMCGPCGLTALGATLRLALAESNRPTLACVEIPTQYIFGAFLTAKRAGS
jgi:hypothetical protein